MKIALDAIVSLKPFLAENLANYGNWCPMQNGNLVYYKRFSNIMVVSLCREYFQRVVDDRLSAIGLKSPILAKFILSNENLPIWLDLTELVSTNEALNSKSRLDALPILNVFWF